MKIHIEYCVKWNYGPEFDRVSKIIKSVDKCITINGNSNPPRSGAFEIEIDSVLVFSKFELGRFPNKKDVLSWF